MAFQNAWEGFEGEELGIELFSAEASIHMHYEHCTYHLKLTAKLRYPHPNLHRRESEPPSLLPKEGSMPPIA